MALTSHYDRYNDIIIDILRGREHILSYPAMSQSISARALAAKKFARVFFELTRHRSQTRESLMEVVQAISEEKIITDIISICSEWSSDLRLDIEDIERVPLFDKSLTHVSTLYGVPNAAYFTRTMQAMQTSRSFAAVIITRYPETIACAMITAFGLDIFVIFDSRPRPNHPFGAGLILSTSIDQVVARLQTIFPALNQYFLSGRDLWRARLLNNVSSRVFMSNEPPLQDVQRSAIESDPAVLRMQAEIASLKQINTRLTTENVILRGNIERLDDAFGVQKTTVVSSRYTTCPFHQQTSGSSLYCGTSSSPTTSQYFEDIQLEEVEVVSTSRSFSCTICMDEHPIDNIVELGCNHAICRNCIRGHIFSKIEERRFPVVCPVCMTEPNEQPGVISGLLVRLIGVNEQQYAVWEEMELSQHSVLIRCRKCDRSVQVDKEEHEASEVLICPLPDCDYAWCKACQQPVTSDQSDDLPHSCDGAAELHRLVQQQGWKYCPNCKIPVERDGGCRHMFCTAPGCNTHFCYGCGGCITRSTLPNQIEAALNTHYRGSNCQLFYVDNAGDIGPGNDHNNENGNGDNFMTRMRARMLERMRRMRRIVRTRRW